MRWLVPTYAYRTPLVRRLGASWLPANVDTPVGNDVTVNAWGELPYRLPAEISDVQRRVDTENRRVEYTWLPTLTRGAKASSALRELLLLCRSINASAALVVMPEGSVFREWQGAEGLAESMRFVGGLGAQHDVAMIDARQWMGDGSFRDSVHLLPAAAREFTVKLAARIDRLID